FLDPGLDQMIHPIAFFAILVIDHGIAEIINVTTGFPGGGMHEDRGIDAHDIFIELCHALPPMILYIFLELAAVLTIIVNGAETLVDLAGWKNKAVLFTV